MITLDDFKKLEIRIGTVVEAEKVVDAEKLVKFVFDIGGDPSASFDATQDKSSGLGKRQIMGAIAEFFPDPSVLVGKQMPILVNLEPRTFRGHESEGMIVAIDVNSRPVFLHPAEDVPAGSIVK